MTSVRSQIENKTFPMFLVMSFIWFSKQWLVQYGITKIMTVVFCQNPNIVILLSVLPHFKWFWWWTIIPSTRWLTVRSLKQQYKITYQSKPFPKYLLSFLQAISQNYLSKKHYFRKSCLKNYSRSFFLSQ